MPAESVTLTREQVRALERLMHTLPVIEQLDIAEIAGGLEITAWAKDGLSQASICINTHGRPIVKVDKDVDERLRGMDYENHAS